MLICLGMERDSNCVLPRQHPLESHKVHVRTRDCVKVNSVDGDDWAQMRDPASREFARELHAKGNNCTTIAWGITVCIHVFVREEARFGSVRGGMKRWGVEKRTPTGLAVVGNLKVGKCHEYVNLGFETLRTVGVSHGYSWCNVDRKTRDSSRP